jgi:hypothetical protein
MGVRFSDKEKQKMRCVWYLKGGIGNEALILLMADEGKRTARP